MILASTTDNTVALGLLTTWAVVILVAYVLLAIALWKVFTKAGHPGVLALIPIVNTVYLVKIAGYSGWLTLLYLIPFVNIVFSIMVALRVGQGFGKSGAFSFFLLWMLSLIGYYIIGFGRDTYTKPV